MFKPEGIYVAMMTPFEDGSINETVVRQMVDFVVEKGVHGIFPISSVGECSSISIWKRKSPSCRSSMTRLGEEPRSHPESPPHVQRNASSLPRKPRRLAVKRSWWLRPTMKDSSGSMVDLLHS
jgi:hypothetical protein